MKAAFADRSLCADHGLASANSINLGRLLPQMSYYAAASLAHWRANGRSASFIVPSRQSRQRRGLRVGARAGPADRRHRAGDERQSHHAGFPRVRATGSRGASIATLASAMDVGNPNNMARLLSFARDVAGVRRCLRAQSVGDDEIRAEIAATWRESARIACPHTATALRVLRTMPAHERAQHDWIAVATAHPAKFEGIVEPIVGRTVEAPATLAALLDRPQSRTGSGAATGRARRRPRAWAMFGTER